ncbi:MAG: PHP domain-containing protein [Clostridiales bacterium]|jgi:predicted metal-dependent phosphoesterase TrpH|nr:PHP domain-containing protein [Clostridiales bacterium]
MQRYIDLHTHTNKSDGTMTPSELVRHAKESGLAAIALTDHDTVAGIEEAVSEGRRVGLEVIPGIELSVISETETHIIGLYIDPKAKALDRAMEKIIESRNVRNIETSRLLKELGIDISVKEAEELAEGGIVGRIHFAKLMVQKGYSETVKEAFDNYLATGKPAFCGRQGITAKEAIEIIRDSGGYSFAAHLHLMRRDDENLRAYIKELKGYGLDGIEGYYTDYSPEMHEKYMMLARELHLKISGGTDFHAGTKPHISIGFGLGNLRVPYALLAQIKN